MKTAWRNNAALYGRDGAGPAGPAGDTFREFEAVTLSTFVEALLPKDARAVFGSGSAGEIWRSMMAEKIAAEVAEAGGIGIADELERTFAREGAAAGGADRADSSRG
jgi:Rod binding domain-containing protein